MTAAHTLGTDARIRIILMQALYTGAHGISRAMDTHETPAGGMTYAMGARITAADRPACLMHALLTGAGGITFQVHALFTSAVRRMGSKTFRTT